MDLSVKMRNLNGNAYKLDYDDNDEKALNKSNMRNDTMQQQSRIFMHSLGFLLFLHQVDTTKSTVVQRLFTTAFSAICKKAKFRNKKTHKLPSNNNSTQDLSSLNEREKK